MRGNGLDGLDLIRAVGNVQVGVVLLQLGDTILALIRQVLEAALAVEAVHRAVGIVLRVIPDEGFVAVAAEDHWPLHAHALETIGVHARLLATGLQADVAGLLGLDHSQRLAVITPQHIVRTALATGVVRKVDFDFLPNLRGITHIPAGLAQHEVDHELASLRLVPLQAVRYLLTLMQTLLLVGFGWRIKLVEIANTLLLKLVHHTLELFLLLIQLLFIAEDSLLQTNQRRSWILYIGELRDRSLGNSVVFDSHVHS